jgi:hypothetical protein
VFCQVTQRHLQGLPLRHYHRKQGDHLQGVLRRDHYYDTLATDNRMTQAQLLHLAHKNKFHPAWRGIMNHIGLLMLPTGAKGFLQLKISLNCALVAPITKINVPIPATGNTALRSLLLFIGDVTI